MNTLRLSAPFLMFCCLAAGCRVSTHDHGKNSNVDIGTPFGSMQVKTDDNVNSAAIGIAAYPGAVRVKSGDGKHSADINMNFGSFHLGVRSTAMQTSDDQNKVLLFYKHELARYGEVLECAGNAAVGEPTRTAQGLTCDEDKGGRHGSIEVGEGLELRTGSPQHQHIVAIESRDGGTHIGLVALDLPGREGTHMGSHSGAEAE